MYTVTVYVHYYGLAPRVGALRGLGRLQLAQR